MLCPFSVGFSYVKRGGQVQKFRRTKYGLAATSAALVALGLTTGMSPYRSAEVVVDGRTIQGGTYATETVQSFLHQEGITVAGYDLVEPARATLLQSGMKIVVNRAKAVAIINGSQAAVTVHTLLGTVGELLRKLRISLDGEDSVSVPLSAAIKNGMTIEITRRSTEVKTRTEAIAYRTVRHPSSKYDAGTDVVVQAGHDGKMQFVTRLRFVNGKLASRRVMRRVVSQPVDEVIDVGTASAAPVVASRSDTSLVTSQVLTVVATAYADPGGHTATGASAGYGGVAVDPGVIPLGTKLYIPGYGYAVADDTGGAIQGYRIDLCFNSVAQAENFGRQFVKVYILGHS